ncbi:MAG: T9SS type A sorting domain-containing protein [Chitinophagales bacterium]
MRKFFYLLFALTATYTLSAQATLSRVLILNEGYYDYFTETIVTPVSVGAYDPASGIYTTIHTIDGARFASDIVVDDDYYFVAADDQLLQYDRFSDELLHSATVPGIRKIALSGDMLILSRGEYLQTFDDYVEVFDKHTLSFQYAVPNTEIAFATEGIVTLDGKAYIAVNNGFDFGNEVGMVAVLDVAGGSIDDIIDLGPNGINPDNIMLSEDHIYTLNNKDYTGSSVSAITIGDNIASTIDLENISAGCGTSVYFNDAVYYQELFGTSLSKYDPVSASIEDETEFGQSFYALAFEPLSGDMYTSETDFFSYGIIHIYHDGVEISSFDAGVSPGNIVFDLRTATGIQEENVMQFGISPNPASTNTQVHSAIDMQDLYVSDLTGRVLLEKNNVHAADADLHLEELVPGNYFITVSTAEGTSTQLFIKL